MNAQQWVLGFALSSILLLDGCQHCCKRKNCPGSCPGNVPPPGSQNLPPQGVPLNPVPGANARAAPEVLLPANVPPGTSGYTPPASRGGAILGEPDFSTPKAAIEENAPPAKQTPPPPMIEEGNDSPLPVAIPNFAEVRPKKVSSGLRPNHLEGFDWLRSNGYKTVLFLRSEKADAKKDDSSDREQVQKRGMNYVSLTITPEKVNQDLVNEFNRIVDNAQGQPIFVYDDVGGSVAGPMWFLYFRTSDLMDNESAIVRARRHGLKEKGDDEQTRLLTAIQKYLSERKQ